MLPAKELKRGALLLILDRELSIAEFSQSTNQGAAELGSSIEQLTFRPNLNLLAAWHAQANGAAASSKSGHVVCSFLVDDLTLVAICHAGRVIDTAAIDCGLHSLQFDEWFLVENVSDGAETFIDATAKDVRVGKHAERDVLELVANLMAEMSVQLAHRKNAPQIAQRLLLTRYLSKDYAVDKYAIQSRRADTQFGDWLIAGYHAAFDERSIAPNVVPDAEFLPVGFHNLRIELESVSGSNSFSITDVPILVLEQPPKSAPNALQYYGYRVDEWMRRHGATTADPIIVSFQQIELPTNDIVRLFRTLQYQKPVALLADRHAARHLADSLPEATVLVTEEKQQFMETDYATIMPSIRSAAACELKRISFRN